MHIRELIRSFNDRAEGVASGEFYLTEKQYKFALALAEKARVDIDTLAVDMGVSFRVWAIGKNARFYGTKYFKNRIHEQQAESTRAHTRCA